MAHPGHGKFLWIPRRPRLDIAAGAKGFLPFASNDGRPDAGHGVDLMCGPLNGENHVIVERIELFRPRDRYNRDISRDLELDGKSKSLSAGTKK